MKRIIFIILFTLAATMLHAQSVNFKWAKQMGGAGHGYGLRSVTTDKTGNVYTTGYFYGTVDFDPGPGTFNLTAGGNPDMFISKLDAAGNFVWVRQMGGHNSLGRVWGISIALDSSGNIYTTGTFRGIIDFDPGQCIFTLSTEYPIPDEGNPQACFVSKIDTAGNFVWAKKLGDGNVWWGNQTQGESIAVDASGDIYIAGTFIYSGDFDPGPGTFNLITDYWNIFVTKLDAAGNLIWAKSPDKPGYNFIDNCVMTLDASGNVFCTGRFWGVADFDPGGGVFSLSVNGNWNIFVWKLTTAGNFVWAKQMGGPEPGAGEYGNSIVVDSMGNVYTLGKFKGTADFDPGPGIYNLTSTGNQDMYISKLTPDGNFVWAKQIGVQDSLDWASIALDAFGNIYTTGAFNGTVDFDPGPGIYNLTSTGNQDMYISKLTPDGNFVWAKQMGGQDSLDGASGISIALDAFGNIYTTGEFIGTVDFDPGAGSYDLTFSGHLDFFVHKMSPCTNSTASSFTVTECKSYMLNGHTYTTSGVYTQTVLNSTGCDSIITLNLTINRIYAAVVNVSACNTYTWHCHTYNNCNIITTQCITYNTSGIYTDTLIAANGCDSIVTLNLTIYPNSTTTFNIGACNSYVWNGQTITSSGTYIDTLIAANGCDSILTLNLTIYPFLTSTVNAAACNSYTWNGQTITASGTYMDTLIAANGCDSIVTLNLIIGNINSTSAVSAAACNIYIWNGQTITSSGTYIDTLVAANGCDSIVTLQLTIKPKSFSTITQSICYGQSYLGHSSSGTYIDTLVGASGCDSIRTLQLTVLPKSFSTIVQTICDGQTYDGHGSSGTYIDTLVATNGCDSITTLQLTVLPKPAPYLGADTALCTGKTIQLYPGQFITYTWQDGSTQNHFTVTQPGLYSVIVSNSCGSGSDEIIIKEGICDIYFPSAFTPNNDGKNDFFKILGAQNLKDYHLAVYNRYGQKVFETNDYTKGWTGDVKGQLQNTGVYVWYCNFKKSSSPENILMKGTVALIR